MCKPFSCIVTKGNQVLICENPNMHSHEDIVQEHNLKDTDLINRNWVRTEVYPYDDYTSDVSTWKFQVDEKDTLPEWFTLDKEVYENKCRKAAKNWKDSCVDKLGQYCIEYNSGNKFWYKEGLFHKLDGPAVEWGNGTKFWYKEGKLHRKDGPAVEYKNGDKEYWLNGFLHRLDGPAIECADGDKHWYKKGLRYREDGPASELASGDKYWYKNNLFHRLDGPACEFTNGGKEYWLNGKQVTESDVMR